MTHDRLLRKAEVIDMTGISPSTLWRLEKSGKFPPRRQIGPNSVAYRLSEIEAWMDSLPTSELTSPQHQVA